MAEAAFVVVPVFVCTPAVVTSPSLHPTTSIRGRFTRTRLLLRRALIRAEPRRTNVVRVSSRDVCLRKDGKSAAVQVNVGLRLGLFQLLLRCLVYHVAKLQL